MSSKAITLGVLGAVTSVVAFQPVPRVVSQTTALQVAVDPTVVSKKDYEDICGVGFDEETLEQRLKRTSYLYPKHVEVIEDIAPIAGAMVDDIVSLSRCVWSSLVRTWTGFERWLCKSVFNGHFKLISTQTLAFFAFWAA